MSASIAGISEVDRKHLGSSSVEMTSTNTSNPQATTSNAAVRAVLNVATAAFNGASDAVGRAGNAVRELSDAVSSDENSATVAIATGAVSVASFTVNARAVDVVLSLFFQSSKAASDSGSTSMLSQAITSLKCTKVAAVALVPIAFGCAVNEARHLITSKHRIDSGLKMMDYLAWTVETTSMSLSGFDMLGVVSDSVGQIAGTAMIGAWGVSAVMVGALNAKILIQSRRFLAELDKKDNAGVINAVIELDDYKLNKHFNMNAGRLRAALERVQDFISSARELNKLDAKDTKKVKKLKKRSLKTANRVERRLAALLKRRITQKNFCNKLAIVSSIITIIAVAILLFSPLAPVGFAALAISSAILLYRNFYDRRRIREFNRILEKLNLRIQPHSFEVGGVVGGAHAPRTERRPSGGASAPLALFSAAAASVSAA